MHAVASSSPGEVDMKIKAESFCSPCVDVCVSGAYENLAQRFSEYKDSDFPPQLRGLSFSLNDEAIKQKEQKQIKMPPCPQLMPAATAIASHDRRPNKSQASHGV